MSHNGGSVDDVRLRRVAVGVGFTEGPVIAQDCQLVFVSIDHRAVYRVDRSGAGLGRLALLGGGPNGLAELGDGSFVVAQNGGYWPAPGLDGTGSGVQQVFPDGTARWVSREMDAPNDVCVGPDGFAYVTDPTRTGSRDSGRIWRCDVTSGRATLLAEVPWYPNGIGFGLDDDLLHVADTHGARVVTMPLRGGSLGTERTLFETWPLRPDGFAFDANGDLFLGTVGPHDGQPGELQYWTRDGELRDRMRVGEGRFCTNVALGVDGSLMVTVSDEGAVLYGGGQFPAGLALHPFRA